MKQTNTLLSLAALLAFSAGNAQAALIAHYTFDVDNSGSTPDSVGSNSATLGNRVQINTSVSGRIGTGALEMLGSGATSGPGDGAVTSNSFSWTSDARTITYWWRADSPNVDTSDGTMISFGDESANGHTTRGKTSL